MSSKTKDLPSSSNNANANESTIDNLDTSIAAKEAPYGTGYAKSGRAKCKGCNELIPKGVLRMAVRYQSKFFDGFQENWHHFECFWKKSRKNDINEASIRGMEWLKWSDQEQIRQRIEELKSFGSGEYTPKSAAVKVEHAKTGVGKCFICKEKIEKGQIRISSRASFHHVKCFANQNSFQKSAEELVGYDELDDKERAELDGMFPKKQTSTEKKRKLESTEENGAANVEESQTPVKKPKEDGNDKDLKKTLKKQSEVLWEIRQALKDNVQKEDMEMLLNLNGGYKSKKDGIEGMVDKLVDMIVYGPPEKCPECEKGRLSYKTDIHAYKCSGNVSEYAPCLYTTRNPERTKFYIPKKMKKENAFLKKLKSPILPERVYPPGALEKIMGSGSKAFKKLDFVSRDGSTSNGKSGKSSNDEQKMVVKHGNVVDPKCTVATNTHVYADSETKRPWQAYLTAMDISTGKNSYYKLQIVKDDHAEEFYLFRSWGRIGTISGGSKTEEYEDDLERCKEDFEHHFLDKTQNTWENYIEGKFKKVASGMDVLEVDFSSKKDDKRKQKLDVSHSKSKLPMEIKELISMVFDINTLTDTMKEFEIDMEKMPLGRLSRNHILKAYKVLTELQQVLEKQQNEKVMEIVPKHQFVDFTNRFYTLIPHATGLASPPLLNNLQILREKTQMLDSLLEIEIAFNIIIKDFKQIDGKDAFDVHYEQLKCSMEVLDQNSDEFKMIKRYLENTHAASHDIQLEIVNVLKIEREEETKRFKKEIGNRHLLWHGSRLSNYAGILSQGLRIAPPEAPVTGYMFGKGIYTADMVTKSANYCYTMDGEGLLLLCDVALGNMQLEKNGKDIKKPKKGKNSVKGIGGTGPNTAENEYFDEMIVPCGKPIKTNEGGLTLLYNEYIVYDEAQIQMRYICRVKFNNKLL